MKKIKVIDISYAQPEVNFEEVKKAGVEAVIIRTGYLNKTDTMFRSHIEGAIAAGLDIGVYTYIMANNTAQAALEAQQTIQRLTKYKGKINYPVFCDMESEKYYDNSKFSSETRTAIIEKFCSVINSEGYYPAVYINPAWLENQVNKKAISGKYDIWLAAWTYSPDTPTRYDYGQTMWQWGTQRISGIKTTVDSNLCYVDYPALIKAAGKNYLSEKYRITAEGEVEPEQKEQVIARLKSMGFTVKNKG